MAIVTGGPDLALEPQFILYSSMLQGKPTDQSPTGETLALYGGIGHLTGADLTYDANGVVASGTITGISEDYTSGDPVFAFSGLSLDGAQVHAWVLAGDNSSLYHALLTGNDTITGTPLDDYIDGLDGHDVLFGGAGADVLFGSGGNDHLYGQSASGGADGADTILGGDGLDYIQGNAGNDQLTGDAGRDRINGGADNDTISGGADDDIVNGNMGNDSITGDGGNDFLRGGQGDDHIDGGAGIDTIMGDLGNDTIIGGGGPDVLTGGDGADTFILFAGDAAFPPSFTAQGGHVVVTDFQLGVDHLVLFNGAAVLHLVDPAPDFTTAESEAQALFTSLHAGANDLAVAQVGNDTYLFWSSESQAFIDAAVQLQNVNASALQSSDFTVL